MVLVCPHCRAALSGTTLPPICPGCAQPIARLAVPVARLSGLGAAGAFGAGAAGTDAILQVRPPDSPMTEVRLGERTRVGRHPVNTLRLTDREISKEHLEITRTGQEFWVQDLNSSNGTFVNGRRVTRFRLKDGDEIGLGSTILLFRWNAPVGASKPNVTMVQAVAPQVLASLRAEESLGFRPERDVVSMADLRADYEKLRIAHEFHRQVGLERDLGKLYDKILKVAFDLLSAETGVVLLYNPQTGELRPDAVHHRKKGAEVQVSQTLLEQVVRTREAVLTEDAILDSRFSSSASIVSQGIRSAMAVPLQSGGELRGVLYLDTRERAGAFTTKDLRLLTGISAQAAVALENADLARRIEQEAEARAHLSRFLSPALVEQAQRGQLDLKKGGALLEVTILFADIRGFTSLTERAQPQEVVTLLNEYFELMVDEVFATGGVLDKFIGDCIMALWGAPVKRADDAARALRAAVGMQETVADYNRLRSKQGKTLIEIGIGVNTGLAVVGNMGSSKRLEYTAIGDSVNLASRLCGLAGPGEIVSSAHCVELAGDGFDVEALPAAKIKGKEKLVTLFRVLGHGEPTNTSER